MDNHACLQHPTTERDRLTCELSRAVWLLCALLQGFRYDADTGKRQNREQGCTYKIFTQI